MLVRMGLGRGGPWKGSLFDHGLMHNNVTRKWRQFIGCAFLEDRLGRVLRSPQGDASPRALGLRLRRHRRVAVPPGPAASSAEGRAWKGLPRSVRVPDLRPPLTHLVLK